MPIATLTDFRDHIEITATNLQCENFGCIPFIQERFALFMQGLDRVGPHESEQRIIDEFAPKLEQMVVSLRVDIKHIISTN